MLYLCLKGSDAKPREERASRRAAYGGEVRIDVPKSVLMHTFAALPKFAISLSGLK